jgi:hypothetical protein
LGVKKRSKNFFKVWFPQEPACTNSFSAQANPSKRKEYAGYSIIFVGVFASVFLTMLVTHGSGLENSNAPFMATTSGVVAAIIISIMLRKKPDQNKPLTIEGKKIAKKIALVNAGIVCIFLGTYFLVNPIIPVIEATIGLWIGLLFLTFLVNNFLFRHLKSQTGLMECAR